MTGRKSVTILLTAGEASGDKLGADLIQALRRRRPELDFRFIGVGGQAMAANGMVSLFDMSELSVLGIFEGVRALPRITRRTRDIAELAQRERPDIAVLIDSWGFSLRVAHRLRRLSPPVPIVKYVGPQVWASRPGRARVLAGAVDHLLSTQSMDAPFYQGLGLPVTFVGNPALTLDVSGADGGRGRRALGIAPEKPMLLVLPGSRRSEIARLSATFGDAAARLSQALPGLAIVIPLANTVAEQVRAATADWPVRPQLVEDEALKLDCMAGCTAALAASGTVSTELALCHAPMVIGYKVSGASYEVIKRLMRTRYITLLNIAADREVAPERIQSTCNGETLASLLMPLFTDAGRRRAQILAQDEALVKMGLGTGDPSERAAEAVLNELELRGAIS